MLRVLRLHSCDEVACLTHPKNMWIDDIDLAGWFAKEGSRALSRSSRNLFAKQIAKRRTSIGNGTFYDPEI